MNCPQPNRHRAPGATIQEILAIASGRWVDVLSSVGIPRECLTGRRGRPCPRCGGRDRFAPMPDFERRGAVLCRHCHHGSTEPRSGDGLATLRWWLGCSTPEALRWLRRFLGINQKWDIRRPSVERRLSLPDVSCGIDWSEIVSGFTREMRPRWLDRVAELLGLPSEPLMRLGVGWSSEHQATTWPMRDDRGEVIGVRLRCPRTGKKWALRGSRAGLFFDPTVLEHISTGRAWIAEGPTDTAALISLGLEAVGVPSTGCGAELLCALGRRMCVREWVLVADSDGPGRAGAERLAESLLVIAPVRIITPGDVKDARAWVLSGADRAAFQREAMRAPIVRLKLKGATFHG